LWECQAKTAFLHTNQFFFIEAYPNCPASQREGDSGAVLRTAAAKGYRLLKPIF